MSVNKPTNERIELYESFKNSLKEGSESDYFDAEDLIAIIDQAVDLQDDYVRIEALMRGYRFFPDNEELAVRRGFLFYDMNLSEGTQVMASHPMATGPLWTLLKMRANADKMSKESAHKKLEKLIERTEEFDDESIIQLIDCASACGLTDWIISNENRLRKKCEYLPALLYELYIVAGMHGLTDYGIQKLEELTELEPFNFDFWINLAQEYVSASREEDALSALEYALAIDSESMTAIALCATALIHLERYGEAEKVLQPHIENMMHEDLPIVSLYARALVGLDRRAEAIELLKDRTATRPDDVATIDLLLRLEAAGMKPLLKYHYETVGREHIKEWIDRANEYYNQGEYPAAAKLFHVLYEDQALPQEYLPAFYSALYVTGQYDLLANWFINFLNVFPQRLTPDICVAGLLSMLRREDFEGAQIAVKTLERMFPLKLRTQWHISSTLTAVGFSTFLNMLGTMLKFPEHFDIEAIDLFTPPLPE